MSFVKSLPILRNLFGCSAASYTKTNRPGDTVTHVQVMPGATLKYEPIIFDMHESSRLNMSFKCPGTFNIIYIMRINIVEAQC